MKLAADDEQTLYTEILAVEVAAVYLTKDDIAHLGQLLCAQFASQAADRVLEPFL